MEFACSLVVVITCYRKLFMSCKNVFNLVTVKSFSGLFHVDDSLKVVHHHLTNLCA